MVEAEVEGIRTEAEEIETRVDFQISHFEVDPISSRSLPLLLPLSPSLEASL